ncbi:tyrosine-type recombinase/integrase [Ferrimonas senticii]|uniref:tyrosine-type recombinase/integrase n=1 Tax=Ferrimonas senticii TaxID=394566 RepID=UPI0004038B08|nr:tyrosine-type recombinase/integrase [Ferrimonas senticii]
MLNSPAELARAIALRQPQQAAAPVPEADIRTLLEQCPLLLECQATTEQSQPKLSAKAQRQLTRVISKYDSADSSRYQAALKVIYGYLQAQQWQLPQKITNQLRQQEQRWFNTLSNYGRLIADLVHGFEQSLTAALGNLMLTTGHIVLYLQLYVAPLSLTLWASVLNNPDALQIGREQRPLLHFPLPNATLANGEDHCASYALDALGYRLLQHHYQHQNRLSYAPLTRKTLLAEINAVLGQTPLFWDPLCELKCHQIVQAFWFHVHQFSRPDLEDWRNPYLSCALGLNWHQQTDAPKRFSATQQAEIYAPLPNPVSACDSRRQPPPRQRWPHEELRLAHAKNDQQAVQAQLAAPPPLDPDNVLPYLLFFYTQTLITEGGTSGKALKASSINEYLSMSSLAKQFPLSLAQCCDETALNQWAQTLYDSADCHSQQRHLYYFLQAIAEHGLTDALTLTSLQSPLAPPSVNPNCISEVQLDQVITLLLHAPNAPMIQRLFAAAAVILAFHGALRRGELLRLRHQDLVPYPGTNTTGFTLTVCNTAEGRTKNGTSRTVPISVPQAQGELLHHLLRLKQGSLPASPIIGFEDESLNARAQHYLLPITRALKKIGGEALRFHHLRHSGALLLTQQGRLLFCSAQSIEPAKTGSVLEQTHRDLRFLYWLDKRKPEALNEALLPDQIGKQLGHSHFATTRQSYLHGHEWLRPVLFASDRLYNKVTLRFIFGLRPRSNDLSRHLTALSNTASNAVQQSAQRHRVLVNEQRLLDYVCRDFQKAGAPNAPIPAPWATQWHERLTKQSHNTLLDYLLMHLDNSTRAAVPHPPAVQMPSLDWAAFNQHWLQSESPYAIALSSKQRAAQSKAL